MFKLPGVVQDLLQRVGIERTGIDAQQTSELGCSLGHGPHFRFLDAQVPQMHGNADILFQTLDGLDGALGSLPSGATRDTFAQQVQDVSATDLANMGLGIDTFVIKDVRDEEGYLDALGRPRVAEVKRDATIAEQVAATKEAEAKRDYRLQQAQ